MGRVAEAHLNSSSSSSDAEDVAGPRVRRAGLSPPAGQLPSTFCLHCAKHTQKAQHARTGSGRRVQGLRLARRRLALKSMRQRGAWRGPPISN